MTDVSTEEGSFGQKRIEYNSPADFADFRRKKTSIIPMYGLRRIRLAPICADCGSLKLTESKNYSR